MTENTPELTVETEGVTINVTDTRSAEAALPFVEAVFDTHLSDAGEAEPKNGERQQYKPASVECDKCGYSWDYRGENPRGSTCPNCKGWTSFHPPLDERGER